MHLSNACNYSETVTVTHEGPRRSDKYETRAWTANNRQFRHEVRFVRKFFPHSYRVTVIANANDDQLEYREFVRLKQRTVPVTCSETVYNFPRISEIFRSCLSTAVYDPIGRRRSYRAAIDLVLQANAISVHLDSDYERADDALLTSLSGQKNGQAENNNNNDDNNEDCTAKNGFYCAEKQLLIGTSQEINSNKLID